MYAKIHVFTTLYTYLRFPAYLTLLAISCNSFANTDWSQCSVPVIQSNQDISYELFTTEIEADSLLSKSKTELEFSGNVQLAREKQKITADHLIYNEDDSHFLAEGKVLFNDHLINLKADTLDWNEELNTGAFSKAEFQLYENHLRGRLESLTQVDESQHILRDVTFTTCDPGKNTWSFSSDTLKLDDKTGRGTSTHTVFHIKDVPVFYFPWFQFPIDERRMSGILTPSMSSSDSGGTQVSVPIYWNMAENYDMTITPHTYSSRGVQLNTENRYLFKQNSGEVYISQLDDDLYNDNRWFSRLTHKADLGEGIQSSLLLQRSSDADYLKDFDHLSKIEDVDYLKNSLNFNGSFSNWSANMLFEQYQTINQSTSTTSRPYERLPQIILARNFQPQSTNFTFNLHNEWVVFERENSVTGERLHIVPTINYSMQDSYFFINPSLQLDLTNYNLENNLNNDNQIQRSIPLLSIDSGLFFERLTTNDAWIQTLEPRLYFLSVPYQDQSSIPDFDTGLKTEDYSSLFSNNRFTGSDRIGDSQQMSLGLSTRLLEKDSGSEFFKASIAQAFYAEDRRVSLDMTTDTRSESNLIGQLNWQPLTNWAYKLTTSYNPESKNTEKTDFAINHKQDNLILNLEYHYRENGLEQNTFSTVYPISNYWTGFAKSQYSVRHGMPVQNLLGLYYEDCCWGFKILYEETSDSNFQQTDQAIFFEFVFKGLSSVGKDIDSHLRDGILGFSSAE